MSKIQSASSIAAKETIYVDVDDEITAIIDKVQSAKGKVVALVLPKRAPVLQSIVNMKLLKRTADNANKNLVLITTEAGLLPLAGNVGLHVASTPNSRPEIPAAPAGSDDEPEDADEPLHVVDGTSDDFDPNKAGAKTVGELAATGAAGKIAADNVEEDIDMNNETEDAPDDTAAPLIKPTKNKKLAIPNFDSFRKKIALGVLGFAVLVGLWIFAFIILPKVTVTISTDTSTINTNLNLTLDTAAKKLDADTNVVPATAQSQQKTDTQQVSATGQQNNGAKASGSAVFYNCDKSDRLFGQNQTLAAGSSISSGGKTYIVQSSVTIPPSSYKPDGTCKKDAPSASVTIQALHGGADYNTDNTTFSVSYANPGDGTSSFSGSGSATGGTDDVVKIVLQADIDGATTKIKAADTTTVKQQLTSGLQAKGLEAVVSTFLSGDPQITTSAHVGDAADTVTITAATTYTMLGVQKADLTSLVEANVNGQLDKGKQVILDNGVANAKFSQQSPGSATNAAVAMTTKSVAGPHLNIDQLKTQLAGMKSADIKQFIEQTPGVTDVQVKFSPFWVNTVPKKTAKVTIVLDKSGA